MKRAFLTDLGLEGEQVDKIMKEHGATVNGLKEELESVETLKQQVKDYEKEVKYRDEQLEELEKKAKGHEELTNEIKEWKEKNKQTAQEYQKKLDNQAFEFKLDKALTNAKARNPKAVKALLDSEKVKMDGDNLIGLEDQLSALKESDAYLFEQEEEPTPPGLQGRQPHPGGNEQPKGVTKEQFNKMGYSERASLYEENPDLYSQLTNE